jgi:hypothetical protein
LLLPTEVLFWVSEISRFHSQVYHLSVLGDKENHIPGLHPAMLVHSTLIFCLLSIPSLFDSPQSILPKLRGFNGFHFLLLFFMFVLGSLVLIGGSKSHPFLLSDNR